MDTFNAGVQYNDFTGTVAADISDNVALADFLVSLGKAEEGERVVGFRPEIDHIESFGIPKRQIF